MHIAIDGYEANVDTRVGVGWYAFELLHAMREECERRGHTVTVYVPTPVVADMPAQTHAWRYVVGGPRGFWTFIGLPFHIRQSNDRADVIFSPTHYIPRFTRIPRVMAIMDLSFLHYPDLFRKRDLIKLTQWTKFSVKHAQSIVTISSFSRDDIIRTYGIRPPQVIVTYPGYRMKKHIPKPRHSIAQKYNLGQTFILSVGTIQPRKNYVRLIEAFGRMIAKPDQALADVQLVIVGKKGWLYEESMQKSHELGIEDRVKFLEFVSDEDLEALYEHARCLALVSLYEGFGLPVLEAMAHGCPVVVSSTSSLPEIAGEAGVYVDPMDITSICQGLEKALVGETEAERKERIEAGKKRANSFRWDRAARQTLDILECVGRGGI